MPKTKTRDEQARRIFYSQADPEQIVRGYSRIHNNMRTYLRLQPTAPPKYKLTDEGVDLLKVVAFAAFLEGWGR